MDGFTSGQILNSVIIVLFVGFVLALLYQGFANDKNKNKLYWFHFVYQGEVKGGTQTSTFQQGFETKNIQKHELEKHHTLIVPDMTGKILIGMYYLGHMTKPEFGFDEEASKLVKYKEENKDEENS